MAARNGESVRVLFRVAAGPRIGYGHLVRATVLARAMGTPAVVSVRGNATACRTARRLGCRVVFGPANSLLRTARPDIVVIDDPSGMAAAAWCRSARSAGVPVASVHDIGIGYCGADLTIDGSVTQPAGRPVGAALLGPRYAIVAPRSKRVVSGVRGSSQKRLSEALGWHGATNEGSGNARGKTNPPLAGIRCDRAEALRPTTAISIGPDRPPEHSVLVALGGGRRNSVAFALARAIRTACPDVAVRVAAGYALNRVRPVADGVTWLGPQRGLGDELARASVAVVCGGVTLYEACCEGRPVVAVAVVPAQRPTIHAFVRAGAALDGGAVLSPASSGTASLTVSSGTASLNVRLPSSLIVAPRLVARMLDDPVLRRRIGTNGRALIDGRGARRVARALAALVRASCRIRRGGRT